MAHGATDWYGSDPSANTYGSLDVAELAVRLGSPVAFDRRGRVTWFNDWHNGVSGVENTIIGAGTENYLYVGEGAYSNYSNYLYCGTSVNGARGLKQVLWYPPLGGVGLECSWRPSYKIYGLYHCLDFYDGAHRIRFGLFYEHSTGNLAYVNAAGSWAFFATPGPMNTGGNCFNPVKLVVNSLTGEYMRCVFQEHVYDMAGYKPQVSAAPSNKALILNVRAAQGTKTKQYALNGYIILTQGEPA